MPLSVYAAAAAVVCSIPVLWWALSGSRSDAQARANLQRPFGDVARPSAMGARPTMRGIRDLAARLPLAQSLDTLERRIAQAGLGARWSLERILVLKVVLGVAALIAAIVKLSSSPSATWVVLCAGGVVLAFMFPDLQIVSKAKERQQKIENQLPDLFDRLTISIEAGLGFDSAMARVVGTGSGPIYDELRWVLQDIQFGLPREAALTALGDRTTVQDLRLFVAALTQSGKYGLPLGEVMRALAVEARDKRRMRAQERAMKIPVKLVLPLITCIMPTLFIVMIGPAALRISDTSFFG